MRTFTLALVVLSLTACASAPPPPVTPTVESEPASSFEAELLGSEHGAPRFVAHDAVQAWPTEAGRIAIFAWTPHNGDGCRASFTLFLDEAPRAHASISLAPSGEQAQLHYVERCDGRERVWKAAAGTVTLDQAADGTFALGIERAAMLPAGDTSWGRFVANARAARVGL